MFRVKFWWWTAAFWPAGSINKMEYRRLGKTDLNLSIIGFGTSAFGDVFGKLDPAEAIRAAHLAIDSGINFFDSSPYYGITLSETRLGEALEGKRDRVILATKCGRYGMDEFDFSAKRVTESVDESLRRLRTDYIDLFQAHDIEFGDVNQVIHEALPAMRRLQEQGKVRYIGITGFPPRFLRRVAETVPVDSILSYCHYNLLNTSMNEVLTGFAQEHGIGLINASGLCMGLLTEKGPPDWHPAPAELRETGRKLAEFCRNQGANISTLGLKFCFDYPLVASTLVGVSTRAEVESALALLRITTDQSLLAQVKAIVAPVFNYEWPSGRPENQQ
jgi:L-galactose dehydrogenase